MSVKKGDFTMQENQQRVTLEHNGQKVTILLTKEDKWNRYGHPIAYAGSQGEVVSTEERRYFKQDWKEC
jgi:hypothetical protein